MLNYYQALIDKQDTAKKKFDQELYEKLAAKFSGTAQDYLNQFKDEENATRAFLIMRLGKIIQDYNILINTPKRINFLTGKTVQTNEKSLRELEDKFWQETSDYHLDKIVCVNCDNISEGGICQNCFMETKPFGTSYSDISRTNFNTKYSYFRKQHFYDCMIQFQGKQPVKIDPELLEKLGNMIKNKNTNFLSKNHLMKWLKELNASKYYESIHLIFSLLTNTPCANFEHLENVLLEDFDQFLAHYHEKFKDKNLRKNFINVQYILYQLLKRHHFPCHQDEFIMPRTSDIRREYDRICREIFADLQWNHTALT